MVSDCAVLVVLHFYVTASSRLCCVHGQAKAGGKKLPPASLTVSPAGLRIVNMASEAVISDLDIYRPVDCTIPSENASVYLYETVFIYNLAVVLLSIQNVIKAAPV